MLMKHRWTIPIWVFFFTIFSSFLCSASLEKKRQIFQRAFSRLLLTFTSFGQKETSKEDGEQEERIGHPPPHIHLPVAFSSGTHLFCGCSSPPGPVTPAHPFQCWMIMLSATAFSRLSSYTLVIFSSFSYI